MPAESGVHCCAGDGAGQTLQSVNGRGSADAETAGNAADADADADADTDARIAATMRRPFLGRRPRRKDILDSEESAPTSTLLLSLF